MLGWIAAVVTFVEFCKLILQALKHVDSSVLGKMEKSKLQELSNALARIQGTGAGNVGYVVLSYDTTNGKHRIDSIDALPDEELANGIKTVLHISTNNAPTLAEKLLQTHGGGCEFGEWFYLDAKKLREIETIAACIEIANRAAPSNVSITPAYVMEQLKQLKKPLSDSIKVLKKMPKLQKPNLGTKPNKPIKMSLESDK